MPVSKVLRFQEKSILRTASGLVLFYCIYMYCIFFIYLSVGGHLNCFLILTIVNAMMNTHTHTHTHTHTSEYNKPNKHKGKNSKNRSVFTQGEGVWGRAK